MRRAVVRGGWLLAAACWVAAVAGAQEPVRRVSIGASGDILFHTRVVAATEAQGGFDHLFSSFRELVTADEIAFANLETPLSVARNPMRADPPILGAPPAAAAA